MVTQKFRVISILVASSALILACQLDQLLPQAQDAASAEPSDTPIPSPIPPSKTPLLPPTPTPTVTRTPIPIRVYATAKADMQVRAAPSTSAKVIDRLAKGNALQVVGRTQASDWWQVVLPTKPNQPGWISAQLTTLNGPADGIPVVNALGTPLAPTPSATPKAGTPSATPKAGTPSASPKAGTPPVSPKQSPSSTIQSKPSVTPTPSRTQPAGAPRQSPIPFFYTPPATRVD